MSRVLKSNHLCNLLLVLLGISSAAAAIESNLLSMEDARKLAKVAPSPSLRIVGGSPARPNQFPYQVALLNTNDLLSCGGSLIADKWVLTAAHCLFYGKQVFLPSQVSVLAGTVNLNQGGARRNVRRVIPHELYEDNKLYHDIAMLELTQTFKLSRSIATIALHRYTVPAGSVVTISGWGRLYDNGPDTNWLQYIRAKVLTSPECALEAYSAVSRPSSAGLICLRSFVNNGACKGDSGGPAVYNNELAGVCSFGSRQGCGTFYSDSYTQVSDYVQWIESKIN